ncbi:hypothetical protein [Spongiactinospora sp. TRM90649]|uniref:hypothetical protein n=1 Tax=Spongiactinospora sp. TRM90649 TaxID=3031114 RepID=UPI0023F9BFDC|nr:hypothetical protein [Spongiactinospora sp. TRM90649]MDF5757217.1 hypothetical protein [Spongiactinospora sp. TRM90649]
MRRLAVAMLALLFIPVAFAVPASASSPVVACGDVLTTSVTLTTDLMCPGAGLTVDADDVVLDLNGHTVTGTGQGAGVTVDGNTGTVVKNGTIVGFTTGVNAWRSTITLSAVRLIGTNLYSKASTVQVGGTLSTCRLDGLVYREGQGLTIDRCTLHGDAWIFSTRGPLAIKNSVLSGGRLDIGQADNGEYSGNVFDNFPVSLGIESRRNVFSANLFRNAVTALSVDAVIVPANATRVERNVFSGNDIGIRAERRIRNIVIRNNLFRANRSAGALLENTVTSASPDPISGNLFIENGHDPSGISDGAGTLVRGGLHLRTVVTAPARIALERNTGYGNAGYLIWAPPGQVIDSGGNKGSCLPLPNPDLTCS